MTPTTIPMTGFGPVSSGHPEMEPKKESASFWPPADQAGAPSAPPGPKAAWFEPSLSIVKIVEPKVRPRANAILPFSPGNAARATSPGSPHGDAKSAEATRTVSAVPT
jgi:hypothetical protein